MKFEEFKQFLKQDANSFAKEIKKLGYHETQVFQYDDDGNERTVAMVSETTANTFTIHIDDKTELPVQVSELVIDYAETELPKRRGDAANSNPKRIPVIGLADGPERQYLTLDKDMEKFFIAPKIDPGDYQFPVVQEFYSVGDVKELLRVFGQDMLPELRAAFIKSAEAVLPND